jgi:uncharacterized protein (TIGR03435 family)
MFRRAVVLAIVAGAAVVSAQVPSSPAPAFEVASVRINTSRSSSSSTQQRVNGSFEMINVTLRSMVAHAFDMHARQILGGPDWIDSERFDVLAKAPAGDDGSKMTAMLRALLVERFRLASHTEIRDQPIYALVTMRSDGRLGPQIAPTQRDCSVPQARSCGVNMSTDGRGTTMQAQAVSLADLAAALAGPVDRMVIDRTGITGSYDVDLRFTRDGMPGSLAGDTPAVFTALQEQLGLRLESARGPVDVLIIDSVQPPTPD